MTEEIVLPTPFTSTVASGTSFYTTSTTLPDGQEEVKIIVPATTTITTVSGTSFYTDTSSLPDGQTVVEVVEPATTTITSYTATTTITTASNTGANGQVTMTVIEPTPGMQYFGFQDPGDADASQRPNPGVFNNKPRSDWDTFGVFPGSVNFYTTENGGYQFPGQTVTTNAANYVVVLEGYFSGPAGFYQVTLSQETDDYGYLYLNDVAYHDWGYDNYYVVESNSEGGGYTQNTSFTLAEGQFVPMTIVWMNVHLSGGLRFWIYPPNDADVVTDTTGWFSQPYTGDAFIYHV